MWTEFLTYKFANPIFLWLIPLVLLGLGLWLYFFRKKEYATIKVSSLSAFKGTNSFKGKLKNLLPVLRTLSLILLLVALARPQTFNSDQKVKMFGIDVVLSLDVSASMLAKDFKPNRLEAAKEVATQFIDARQGDRVGLVSFSGESFTQVPITTDHLIVKSQLQKIKYGFLAQGTAIGMGIATAVNRLKNSDAKSKVIILMTDGVNNTGLIAPQIAVETANQYGIKIYTIGVGSKGKALMPVAKNPDGSFQYDYALTEIDEKLLKEVAQETGGKYYRATNNTSLEEIYEAIDKLEKTEIQTSQTLRTTEKFYFFALLALTFLLVEMLLRYALLRSVP